MSRRRDGVEYRARKACALFLGLPHDGRHTRPAQACKVGISCNVDDRLVESDSLGAQDARKHLSAYSIGFRDRGLEKSDQGMSNLLPVLPQGSFCGSGCGVRLQKFKNNYVKVYTCSQLDLLGCICQTDRIFFCCCLATQQAQFSCRCHYHLLDDIQFEGLGIAQSVNCNEPWHNKSLNLRSIRLDRKNLPWTRFNFNIGPGGFPFRGALLSSNKKSIR